MRGAMDGQSHDDWEERLSEYLDGGLAPAEVEALRGHLSTCMSCRDVLADLERVRRWAREQPPIGPRRDLWPDIRRTIHGTDAGEATPGFGAAEAEGVRDGEPRRAARAPTAGAVLPEAPEEWRGQGRSGGQRRGVYVRIPQLAAAVVALLLVGAAGGVAVLGTWDGVRQPFEAAFARGGGEASEAGGTGGSPALALEPVPIAEGGVPAVAELADLAREAGRLQARIEAAADRLDPVTVEVLQRNLAIIDRAIREATEALARQPDDPYVREHLVHAWERRADLLRQVADVASWREAD